MSEIPARLIRAATLETWAARQERKQAVLEERVNRATLAWIDSTKADVTDAQIRSALAGDNPAERVGDLVAETMESDFDLDLEGVANDVASEQMREVARSLGVPTTRIDPANVQARSAAWAEDYMPALSGEITDQTRRAVGDRVAEGLRAGQSNAMIANRVKEVIGLTEIDADAVERVRAKALADGKTAVQADRMAERFADQKREFRAETIARTETQRAASAGRDALWDEFADAGVVDPGKVVRIWITQDDDDVDDTICRPLHEKEAKLGEPFPGGFFNPPAHPRCRCKTFYEART